MPNTIKDIRKIANLVSEADLVTLEKGAALHKRHSNITFKILSVEGKTVFISTRQEKHLAGNYLSGKDLITRTKELFSKFLPGFKLNVGPVKYSPNIIDTIDAKYVATMMHRKGVRLKDLAADTGIDKTNLSHWINGNVAMSQAVKAMFYYYFLWRQPDHVEYIEVPNKEILSRAYKSTKI